MILRTLFGEACESFLESHFLIAPFARPGGCRAYCRALGQDELIRAFDGDNLDIVVGRDGQPWHDAVPPKNLDEARNVLAHGGTLCVRHAERHAPAIATLADEFRRDLQAPVDVHLHWTPPMKSGFGWHYDAEDVFVLQIAGSKEWWLRKNTVNPWPLMENLPNDMQYEREVMPAMRCLLGPGDVLYVPHGYWHRTMAGETSLSLSVGMKQPTALDLLDFVRQRLSDSLRWRQRLPYCTDSGREGQQKWQAMRDGLGRDIARALADPPTLAAFWPHWSASGAPDMPRGSSDRQVQSLHVPPA